MRKKKKSDAYRIAVIGMLAAEAVALSFLESLLPATPFLPPGAKPGLANVVVMFAAVSSGLPATLAVILVKSLYTLVSRGLSAFLISLCGGLCSGALMALLTRRFRRRAPEAGERRATFGYVGVSVLSATAHNMGQLAAASLIAGTSLLSYLPFLILFGILFGSVTGTVLGIVMPALEKQSAAFTGRKKQNGKVKDHENQASR